VTINGRLTGVGNPGEVIGELEAKPAAQVGFCIF